MSHSTATPQLAARPGAMHIPGHAGLSEIDQLLSLAASEPQDGDLGTREALQRVWHTSEPCP